MKLLALLVSIGDKLESAYWYVCRNTHRGYYYLKCALWKKYNTVKVRTLPPTWVDRCDLLPHVMFQILDDFVKKECSPGMVDWNADDEHKKVRQQMDDLLNWWHNVFLPFDPYKDFDESKKSERLFVEKEKNGSTHYELQFNEYEKEFYDNVNKQESELYDELEKKLKEIIDLRPYLWT